VILTLDRKPKAGKNPPKTGRAERVYAKQLESIARHVGEIINGFEPGDISAVPSLTQMLSKYAEALRPWATATANKMLGEVNARDIESWRDLGNAISVGLRNELINAPVGAAVSDLLRQQVTLITSIPTEAAQRVHDLTIKGLEDSRRYNEYVEEIERSGDVAKSRAILIARTEVSRTASTLTQARAEYIGSEGYNWRTAHDGSVRYSHKKMEGKFVYWSAPPTLDNLTGHAGCLPNCRCYPEPVLRID